MKKLLSLLLIAFLVVPLSAQAKGQDKKAVPIKGRAGIVATVNDDVITATDLENRIKLYLSGSPGQPPPEILKRMHTETLDKMIDEKLQLREAKSLGVSVAEDQIAEAVGQVAKQNNFTAEEFKKRLAASGVQISTLVDQLRAEIAWSQVIRRRLRPEITVSENDIDSAMAQLSRNRAKPQYRVAEIYLTVAGDAQDANVKADAQKLVNQIIKGARFSDIARQFSQAPGASNGGDLGWVQEGQLDAKLDAALKQMHPGQLSPPVRTVGGYHILFLRDVQQPGGATPSQPQPQPPSTAEVAPLQEGVPAPAAPAAAEKTDQASREEIANKIGMQRLDQMQDRYLRDLRATAFIEKRI
jgi:peptidyl-prolyl cis-trans isomerase SurA